MTFRWPFFVLPFLTVACDHHSEENPGTPSGDVSSTPIPALFGEGVISTGDYETHPAFSSSGDTVYFLKCFPDVSVCAICVSWRTNGHWSPPEIMPFSGQYQDVDPFISKDGNTFYFASNRPVKAGDSVRADWDIWTVQRRGMGWDEPVHLDSPWNSSASEYFPTITDDGTLYFGSARPGGHGGADIYFCRPFKPGFSTPKNVGAPINTQYHEYEPFIAPDESYLLFMATIPNGLSNSDLYISYRHDSTWTAPRKLREPINSSFVEWGAKVSHDGKFLFFGSTRNRIPNALPQRANWQQLNSRLHEPGNGLGDIYYTNFDTMQVERDSTD